MKYNIKGIKDKLRTLAITGLAALVFNCGDTTGLSNYNPKTNQKYSIADITDHDNDGIPTEIELAYGLNPYDADTDDDGLMDGTEGLSYFSNRSNGIRAATYGEVFGTGTDPLNSDTDGDGLSDGLELGLQRAENKIYSRGFNPDKDPNTKTDPLNYDTDGDGLSDGEEDSNYDGKTNNGETRPDKVDSNNDGFTDGYGIPVTSFNGQDKTPPTSTYAMNFSGEETPLAVAFDSSGSDDVDSGIAQYSWDFNDDMVIDSNEANPVFIYTVPGVYHPKLLVSNGSGLYTSSSSLEVVVSDSVPVADAGVDLIGVEGDVIDFSGNVIATADLPLSYDWDFGDGNSSSLQNPSNVFSQNGLYNVFFTVVDNDGSVASDSLEVIVNDTVPVVDAGADQNVFEGDVVNFNANANAYDLPLTYYWDFGDGNVGTGVNPTNVYAQSGVYPAVLTVVDNDGSVASDSLEVVVNSPPVLEKIAFISNRDGNYEIYTMNADGTNQVNITNNPSWDGYQTWSPDGKKIAFTSDRDGNYEIYTMNADGTNQVNITNNPSWDAFPAWSPDGTKIAYSSGNVGSRNIYTMDVDGTNKIMITNSPQDEDEPDWSPDGVKIAFERCVMCKIMVINSDGTGEVDVSNYPGAHNSAPAWSPDGSKISFYANRVRGAGYQLYVMDSDGNNQIRLSSDNAEYSFSDWSPDGTKIIFGSNRDGNYEIYTINPDGSNLTRLTNNIAVDAIPKWTLVY